MIKNVSRKILFLLFSCIIYTATFSVFGQEQEILINKKPFVDFGKSIAEKIKRKDLDLDKPFSVMLAGLLDEKGKLVLQKSRFVQSKGDLTSVLTAKELIEALNDSGFFVYLSNLGIRQTEMVLAQDGADYKLLINSEINIKEDISKIRSALFGQFAFHKIQAQQMKQPDALLLLERVKISSDEQKVSLEISVEKEKGKNWLLSKLKDIEN